MKHALITGATSGIGECLVHELAKNNYHLILTGRNKEKLKDLQKDIQESYNVNVKILQLDLREKEALHTLVDTLEDLEGSLNLFVNNAGIGHYGPFLKQGIQEDLDTIAVNITAFTYLTKAVYPYLVKDAKVLQVASTAAFAPGPYMAVYYASKAYVLSLSLALRKEWKRDGINVSVLCPGPTKTSFQSRAHMEKAGLANKLAMSPEDVARISYKGIMKNKALIIPGISNKIAARVMEVIPHTLGAILVNSTQKK